MKVSTLKRPMNVPWRAGALVSRSPWYQEIPNGALGTWMTKKSKSVLRGRWSADTRITSTGPCDRMVTAADAPLRHPALTATPERTMWNEACVTAASAPGPAIPMAPPAAARKAAPATALIRLDSLRMCTLLRWVSGL